MQTLSPRLGNAEPTARHVPPDAAPNPAADDCVGIASLAGLELLPWQESVLRDSLMVRRSDLGGDVVRFAATECVVDVPRQNGKGSILEARQLAGLFVLDVPLQIHSAHEFKTALEHFLRIKELVEGSDYLMQDVKLIRTGAGDQSIELKNGNRLKFLARSGASGRGFSADVVYLDEAFKLDNRTMGAILPTMMARPNPQIWYTSSAPHKDSEVLHRMVERGRAGDGSRLFFVEWANDPDTEHTDREAWYRVNPSLGTLIDEDMLEMSQSTLDPQEFAREHLGVPEESAATADVPIPLHVWEALTDGQSMAEDGQLRVALDVSPDRSWATFSVAGIRADGLRHVAVRDRRPGTGWVRRRAKELAEGHGVPIVICTSSPGLPFIDQLLADDVPVDPMSPNEYAAACGRFIDATRGESPILRHRGDPNLRLALASVKTKPHGDGGIVWSRRSTEVDITPLTASTMAWGRLDTLTESTEFLGGFTSLEDWLED